jgi:flagellar assembly protein FliH
MASNKFLFDQDFSRRNVSTATHMADLADAERRGMEQGRQMAEMQINARLSEAVLRLGQIASSLFQNVDSHLIRMEEEAVMLAVELAKRAAGQALDKAPLAALEDITRRALQHVRGVPHLVVRVNEALVEQAEPLVTNLAQQNGYEGRMIVMGEPGICLGDARLGWADGGITCDRAAINTTIDTLLNDILSPEAQHHE